LKCCIYERCFNIFIDARYQWDDNQFAFSHFVSSFSCFNLAYFYHQSL
jgi:hypothetical protein